MEELIRSLMICELKAQLNSCEFESRVLAKEIVYPNTPVLRRHEALILRARLQTERVGLERQLAGLGVLSFDMQGVSER
jgi:hypothetical protein